MPAAVALQQPPQHCRSPMAHPTAGSMGCISDESVLFGVCRAHSPGTDLMPLPIPLFPPTHAITSSSHAATPLPDKRLPLPPPPPCTPPLNPGRPCQLLFSLCPCPSQGHAPTHTTVKVKLPAHPSHWGHIGVTQGVAGCHAAAMAVRAPPPATAALKTAESRIRHRNNSRNRCSKGSRRGQLIS